MLEEPPRELLEEVAFPLAAGVSSPTKNALPAGRLLSAARAIDVERTLRRAADLGCQGRRKRTDSPS